MKTAEGKIIALLATAATPQRLCEITHRISGSKKNTADVLANLTAIGLIDKDVICGVPLYRFAGGTAHATPQRISGLFCGKDTYQS